MPFLDHLEELRWRIIWSVGALVVGSVVGFVLVTQLDVIGLLARPIQGLVPEDRLLYTNPTTPIMVSFKLAFVVGVVLALPVLAYQGWEFISPALLEREKKAVIPAIGLSFLLFLAGLAMAYFLVLPLGLRFLLEFQAEALEPIITVDEYLRFATRLILAFGVVFELPVILGALGILGVVTADGLRTYRRHALLAMSAVAAFFTPADVGTMLMMLGPMWILYELSILLVARLSPRVSGAGDGERAAS
jgi:sec-independent protein translocase protein TatC